MRKYILYLIPLLFISCEREPTYPRSYSIEIAITNENNDDLVKGLKCSSTNHKSDGLCDISELEFRGETITDNNDVHMDHALLNTTRERQTIILGFYTWHKTYPNEVTFEIVCYHIFKDYEKHQIITKWVHPEEKQSYCTSIIINDKEYHPTYKDMTANSYVEVVFDKP